VEFKESRNGNGRIIAGERTQSGFETQTKDTVAVYQSIEAVRTTAVLQKQSVQSEQKQKMHFKCKSVGIIKIH